MACIILVILYIVIIEQMFYIIFIATEEVHRGMAFIPFGLNHITDEKGREEMVGGYSYWVSLLHQ